MLCVMLHPFHDKFLLDGFVGYNLFCVLFVEKCDAPLGMEEGMPRLGSNDNWCGKYVNGETALKIRFKSVVKITDVYFRRADEKKANEGWFHYFDATRRSFFFRKVVRRCCKVQFCFYFQGYWKYLK